MSVIITFADGSDQRLNSFAFRRLLTKYARYFPEDSDAIRELETVAAVGGIEIRKGEQRSRSVLKSLEKIALRTIDDLEGGKELEESGPGRVDDAIRVYRRLLALTQQALAGET